MILVYLPSFLPLDAIGNFAKIITWKKFFNRRHNRELYSIFNKKLLLQS